jgi:hypothetical protein
MLITLYILLDEPHYPDKSIYYECHPSSTRLFGRHHAVHGTEPLRGVCLSPHGDCGPGTTSVWCRSPGSTRHESRRQGIRPHPPKSRLVRFDDNVLPSVANDDAMTSIKHRGAPQNWSDVCFPDRAKQGETYTSRGICQDGKSRAFCAQQESEGQKVSLGASKDGFTAIRKTNALHALPWRPSFLGAAA